MTTVSRNPIVTAGTVDTKWRGLYKIGGAAILISLAIIPLSIISYIAWPVPGTALESFTLFQNNPIAGLLSLDLLYLTGNIVAIPVFLALYAALKRTAESSMAIATGLGFFGIAALFSARPILEMLSLSQRYAAATTEVQRSIYLAAGEALLSHIDGTAFQLHYFLGSVALLIISLVMLRSNIFNKATAYSGILANVLVFGLYVPKIGIILSILSVFPFLTIWYILMARRLFQLGKSPSTLSEKTGQA
jgi:hypothetical protein